MASHLGLRYMQMLLFEIICINVLTTSPKLRTLNFRQAMSLYAKTKMLIEPRHEISNNVVCATSKGSDQPVHTGSLIRAFASCLNIL